MKTSPTQRSLLYLRKQRYLPAVVERWNPHAHIRQDLWGCLDLVAVSYAAPLGNLIVPATLGVQTTTSENLSARVEKLLGVKVKPVKDGPEMLLLPLLFAAGWAVHVHGWRKLIRKRNRWFVRIHDMKTGEEWDG